MARAALILAIIALVAVIILIMSGVFGYQFVRGDARTPSTTTTTTTTTTSTTSRSASSDSSDEDESDADDDRGGRNADHDSDGGSGDDSDDSSCRRNDCGNDYDDVRDGTSGACHPRNVGWDGCPMAEWIDPDYRDPSVNDRHYLPDRPSGGRSCGRSDDDDDHDSC